LTTSVQIKQVGVSVEDSIKVCWRSCAYGVCVSIIGNLENRFFFV